MTVSRDSAAWERLGAMLIQRRTAVDPRYHSRGAFCEASGLKYRLVYDVEEAKRTNFGSSTLAAIEVAYHLDPGAITRYLGGGELIHAANGNRVPPQAYIPIPEGGPDEIGADERQVWAEVADALGRHGPGAAGAQVFPASATEAGIWDTRKLRNRQEKVQFIAQLRSIASAHDPESRTG